MSIIKSARTLLYGYLLLNALFCNAVTIESGMLPNRMRIEKDWKLSFSDNDGYKSPLFDDSDWIKVDLPFSAGIKESGGSRFLWLRKEINADAGIANTEVYLLFGKIDAAVEVYYNGVKLTVFGKFPPDYNYVEAIPRGVLLPRELMSVNQPNVISLRFYSELAVFEIHKAEIGDYDAYIYDSKFLKFINLDLYIIFSFLTLVIAGYFLLQFLSRRSEKTNLHFSLANFCFAIYFFSMGLENNPLSFKLGTAISQSFMPLFFPLLVVFFVNYFQIHNKKWLKRIIMGLGFFLSSLFYLDLAGISFMKLIGIPMDLFTFTLAPGGLELVFMTYIAIRAVIKKNRDALAIMIGTLFGFIFAIHDMVYQFSGMQPFTWLQGIGIFLFDMSMFVSLSNRNMRAFKDLEISSIEIVAKTGELETYINNIQELSDTVSGMSSQLDSSVVSASSSINKMAASSESIITDIKAQADTVDKTSSAVTGLLDALEVTYGDLGKQFSHVQETSATIEEMIANIAAITKNVKHTTEFAEELRNSTVSGETAVLESSKSIEGIRVVSENVNKIIDTVSDIAEQTNILSINAAIEASHAGIYGKGFAVVAGEIRRLSEGSSRNSKEISGLIKTIGARIKLGVQTNDRVKEIFSSINGKTSSAVDQIQEIYQAVLEQKTASEDIMRTLGLLQTSSEEMKKQADVQSSSGGIIRTNLESLVSSTGSVIEMVNHIANEISAVLVSIEHLKEISSESIRVISRLKSLMEKEKS
jgi:methyl-accepting chemotaxis protein